ncbi:MAG: peptidylprolyl isomerase [Caldisericia bacterium]|nr:peptidylprolyl isomerase [Caldisericia bacterium]
MKKYIVVLTVVLMLASFVGCGGEKTADETNGVQDSTGGLVRIPGPKGVIATVGQVDIPSEEYLSLLNSTRIAMIDEGVDLDAPESAEVKLSTQEEIIESLIELAVYENYAIENNLMPSMVEIEDAISQEVEKQALKMGSYELLEKTLKDEGGVKELRRLLRSDLKFKEKMFKEKVIIHLKNQIEITDEEALEFFESRLLGLSQIVIAYDPENHTEEEIDKAEKYTEAVRKRIGKDMTFSEAVYEYSMDMLTVQNGGQFAELTSKGVLIPELEEIAFSLSSGGVSNVIDTGYSFVILKLEHETYAWDYYFTDNGKLPKPEFESVKEKVYAQLRMIREYEHEQIWYKKYRDSLDIQVYLELSFPETENSEEEN